VIHNTGGVHYETGMMHTEIHKQIKDNDIIELYVLNKLSAEERLAFQQHFFECDQCFEQAQIAARFVAGVRDASKAGLLTASSTESAKSRGSSWWVGWLKPVFALTAIASLALAIALVWLVFNQIPRLRQELVRERQAREQSERENQQNIDRAKEELENERRQLEIERGERAKAQGHVEELARNREPQPNVPMVMLEAVRSSRDKGNQLNLPATAGSAIVWIDVESGNRFDSFRLQIMDSNNRLVETIAGAKPNSYGALVVNVPTKSLQSGKYVVRLYGVKSGQREFVGEYDLQVRKR
jgi:anti-sigma factor RsiW